jgi:histidinol dehydrogenase
MRVLRSGSDDVFLVLRARTVSADTGIEETVKRIIADVAARGDEALLESARRFDSPHVNRVVIERDEIANAPQIPALEVAADRIRSFHDEQFRRLSDAMEWSRHGVGQRMVPLTRVGVYVPGGKASYPSSVLMNVLPARAANVSDVVIASPVGPDGKIPASVLRAAGLCGVTEIVGVGGAAAIASLALGTESILPVDKIVGPGNKFVNEAKRQLWGRVGLDGYTGPSEVCVFADEGANPAYAAADLLCQIEHSEDNAAFLITVSDRMLQRILPEIHRLLSEAPRAEIIRSALEGNSCAIVARSTEEAVEIINAIAPEHLSLMGESAEAVYSSVRNAGCILIGDYTPQSAADWVLGPSHTLPTSRAARFGSPVNVLDFLKVQSVSNIDRNLLEHLGPTLAEFGRIEGFPMHARAAALRLNSAK